MCNCDTPSTSVKPFGTSYSQGYALPVERTLFAHHAPAGHTGVMTHLWLTPCHEGTVIRYYLDGETNASIAFPPSLAAGVGFHDQAAPWGNKWIGKAAKVGGLMWNFRVPFQSLRITVETPEFHPLYLIVRGALDVPINIGGVTVPLAAARLRQYAVHRVVQPLDMVTLAEVEKGKSGLLFMHTLSAFSANPNFLEGCYHFYSPADEKWPGLLLSSGTEDYFDSAYYFDAGPYHLPVSGLTHEHYSGTTGANVSMSAYRFHEEDPIRFDDGMRFEWRVGDLVDFSINKCYVAPGEFGKPVGDPQPTQVFAYAWLYVW